MARTERTANSYVSNYAFGTSAYDYSLYAGTTSSMRVVASAQASEGAVRSALRAEARRRNANAKATARRDVILLAFLLVFCVGGLLLVWQPQADAAPVRGEAAFELVTVGEGDTLWAISERYPVRGLSTQENVRWIMQHNEMTSSVLRPGQVIEVQRTNMQP